MSNEIARRLGCLHGFETFDFLIGLFKNQETWTLITIEQTYFMIGDGLKTVENNRLASLMEEYYSHHKKGLNRSEIDIGEFGRIWIANEVTAYAIENLFLLTFHK